MDPSILISPLSDKSASTDSKKTKAGNGLFLSSEDNLDTSEQHLVGTEY